MHKNQDRFYTVNSMLEDMLIRKNYRLKLIKMLGNRVLERFGAVFCLKGRWTSLTGLVLSHHNNSSSNHIERKLIFCFSLVPRPLVYHTEQSGNETGFTLLGKQYQICCCCTWIKHGYFIKELNWVFMCILFMKYHYIYINFKKIQKNIYLIFTINRR